MSENKQREMHIVVGYDGTEQAAQAVRVALKQIHERNGMVHILEVLKSGSSFDDAEAQQSDVEAQVNQAAKDEGVEGFRVLIHTRIGAPAKELVALADETDADMVVVGTHGRKGVSRLIMGSVAEKVLRNAHCPVLVVRPVEHRAAAEGSDPSLQPEPPCPGCVAKRVESKGAQWWCEAHDSHPQPRGVFGGKHGPAMGDWSRFNR